MDAFKSDYDHIAALGDRAVAIAAFIAVLVTGLCGDEPAVRVASVTPTAQAQTAQP